MAEETLFTINDDGPERESVFRRDSWEAPPKLENPRPSEWWVTVRLTLLTLAIACLLFALVILGCLACVVALLSLGLDVQYSGVIGAMTAFVAAAYAWEWMRRDGLSPSVVAWLILGGGK